MLTDERWRNVDENSYLKGLCRSCIKVDEREKKEKEREVLEREAERKEGRKADRRIAEEERWGGVEDQVQKRSGEEGDCDMRYVATLCFCSLRYCAFGTHLCLLASLSRPSRIRLIRARKIDICNSLIEKGSEPHKLLCLFAFPCIAMFTSGLCLSAPQS